MTIPFPSALRTGIVPGACSNTAFLSAQFGESTCLRSISHGQYIIMCGAFPQGAAAADAQHPHGRQRLGGASGASGRAGHIRDYQQTRRSGARAAACQGSSMMHAGSNDRHLVLVVAGSIG
jgi:hypothetical protein